MSRFALRYESYYKVAKHMVDFLLPLWSGAHITWNEEMIDSPKSCSAI